MYYKKVWVIILIIVVMGALFPSVLIARAEGEFPPHNIPDLEYSLQDAPFPGEFEGITEEAWQSFIDRAEELEHTIIKRLVYYDLIYDDNTSMTIVQSSPVFFSTDGTSIEEHFSSEINMGIYQYSYTVKFVDPDENNILNTMGHQGQYGLKTILSVQGTNFNPPRVTGVSYTADIWYRADIVDNPYQNKPPRYNIDPTRGLGMSFLKPAFGEWINIPHILGTYRDVIEIEIQIPQLYEASNGITYKMFDVSEGIGQMAVPNFGIRLYTQNTGRIEGSQVVGRDGIWILPNNIRFVEGYMDGSYMHSARFIARVPIEHVRPDFGGNSSHSLIVADMFIHKTSGSANYSKQIPEARTWTKYLIYHGVVDEDGDGYDDRTGIPINDGKPGAGGSIKDDKPNKDDYEDGILGTISYYFDTFIWYIKQPFVFIADLIGNIINWISTTIDSWIDSFTSIFTKLFSFLPAEVILMLALGFATMMIITIIRAIRGS